MHRRAIRPPKLLCPPQDRHLGIIRHLPQRNLIHLHPALRPITTSPRHHPRRFLPPFHLRPRSDLPAAPPSQHLIHVPRVVIRPRKGHHVGTPDAVPHRAPRPVV
ncbi:hypothetical protein ACRALDRAFT_1060106 [Sodiomyces alcalophilus JCM 7366]|uniref:uncharacterized protein n=1 Tax=Sodiomyces alcalophilus JCM 7366 TaxID=591952 RepID=UPI0039B3A1A0